MHSIPFLPHQREELLRIGVQGQAISCIEIEALPMARRFLTRPPRKKDVLDELHGLQKKLAEAHTAVERLLDANAAVPHLREAQAFLAASQGRHALGGLRLHRTSRSLAEAIDIVTAGIATIPPGPLRHRSADPYPIKLIHSALQHAAMFESGDPALVGLEPSSSPASPFRRLVGICYDAIGVKHADPERALKAYMKAWRALEKHLENAGLGTERPAKT